MAAISEQVLADYVEQHSSRVLEILRDLVRIPSENTAPTGAEAACQQYIADFLARLGLDPVLYSMDQVPGLRAHPVYFAGRDYADRPNVGARRNGSGAGSARSLLLSGHVDTVPIGMAPWLHDPFGGEIVGNRLYGRGSNDMKGGIATNLFVFECLHALGVQLPGDLLFESVIDEEFGGANGTLAGRLMGFDADAVVLSEPSFLRVCPAQRGGRIAHITLRASGGILRNDFSDSSAPTAGVIDQLTFLLARIQDFSALRRHTAPAHPLYPGDDPVPVAVTKIFTAAWGNTEPVTIPTECKVALYWQTIPGERVEDIDREFLGFLSALPSLPSTPFRQPLDCVFSGRWLPGSAIDSACPLVTSLAACARRVLGNAPAIAGIEGPCDMFVFHQVAHTPAVLWGARGGNTHAPDEYVEIDSLIDAAKVLLAFTVDWCSTPS